MQVVTGIMAAIRRFVLVVILCAVASPVWADYQAGYDAYDRGDYATALREWKPLAYRGNATAQFLLGMLYDRGEGVPQDYAEAAQWYHKAAVQGNATTQFLLGDMHNKGQGVPQSHAEAAKWYRRAAEQGNAMAQHNLGIMYANGQGVQQDYAEAVKWYRRAADQGTARAQHALGVMYDNGQGVQQDYAEAVKWYRRAADQGDADGQSNLGFMYHHGRGVAQDYAEAVKWFRKATDQGHASGQRKLGFMYEKGLGVAQDYAEAVKWYRKAADQGDAAGQSYLGVMHFNGYGVQRDYPEAYFWFSRAAAQGYTNAKEYRDMAANQLPAAQLARVQEWVDGRRAKPPSPPSQKALIREVQDRLARLGYVPGDADGLMGRKTRNAIEAFQRDQGLPVTGKPTQKLAGLMESKLTTRRERARPATPPPAAPSQTADLGTFHALVIGNDDYRSLTRLRTAVKDARAVAALLQNRYGFRATTLTNATRADVIQALEGLRARLTERDNLLIYYAGHGQLDRGADRGYWLPIDATEDSQVNWLSNTTITDTLKAIQAKHVMVVADSCYSGTLTRDTRGIEVRVKKSDYVAKTHGKKSRTVLASGGLEPVSDSGGSGHSVFAKAFMDALRDNEGVIDGLDVFSYVRKQVRLNADQVPNYANIRYAGHEVGGDFLFARKLE
jgi:uncharacterized protein